jgi:hypothetical protein
MTMAAENLEKRLAALEAEVSELRRIVKKEDDVPWWQKIMGTFANDPYYEEAMRLGREYRESTRPKLRKKKKKKRHGDT